MKRYSRRQTLVMSSALVPGSLLAGATRATGKARVVVVGGGFGGASAARTLHRIAPEMDVTLIVDADRFSTCPFSNLVIAGEIPLSQITFGYDKLAAEGVKVLQGRAVEVDAARKVIRLEDGRDLAFDRAILSPGIDLKFTAIPGYNAAAADQPLSLPTGSL
jgi:sulfide dehydrogenase [flavocytochrome c] flavoprotein subunit